MNDKSLMNDKSKDRDREHISQPVKVRVRVRDSTHNAYKMHIIYIGKLSVRGI